MDNFGGKCPSCFVKSQLSSENGFTVDGVPTRGSANVYPRGDIHSTAAQEKKRAEEFERMTRRSIARMILTTESSHNLEVKEHLGIVTAEVVVGMNIFKDIMAGVRNIVGGKSKSVQKGLKDIRIMALEELKTEAANLNADAVVGVSLAYNEIGATGSTMLMLVASGTAVKLQN